MKPVHDRTLRNRISTILAGLPQSEILLDTAAKGLSASAVLVPIGADSGRFPCLIFNKRSQQVRQAGDLCFPGGSPEPGIDRILSAALHLPGSPLRRWPHYGDWCRNRGEDPRKLPLMLAAGLREGFEEMRINPLDTTFLGPLPAQQLVLFRRVIHPMVLWLGRFQRFQPNWEVQRIVRIRIPDLLQPDRYRRYRITYSKEVAQRTGRPFGEFPAYRHRGRQGEEILWGATFRITAEFMKLVFNFTPPDPARLPRVDGFLNDRYYVGESSARFRSR